MLKLLITLSLLIADIDTSAQFIAENEASSSDNKPYVLPFDFKAPDAIFEMPTELVEISGLSISSDNQYLIAVQDEDGIIFKINMHNGAVEHQFNFWKEGDYEGLEAVEDNIFVVKSTGTIYKIKNPDQNGQEVVKYKFFLNKDNDVEGLGLDARGKRLLLACKAKSGTGEHMKLKKSIYAFDLTTEQMDSIPAFTVSLESILTYLELHPELASYEKLTKFFIREDGKFKFSPSAIAIHPKTSDIYITSAVGKLMVILNAQGELIHIEKLKKSIHAQPEGLCFDKEGNMYIANEGKDESAYVYKFMYRP